MELYQESVDVVVAWVVALVYPGHILVLQGMVVAQAVVFLASLVQGHLEEAVELEEVVQVVVVVLPLMVAWVL